MDAGPIIIHAEWIKTEILSMDKGLVVTGHGKPNQMIRNFLTDFNMKEPIIVSESGSVDIFDTRTKAESYLEPIDVKNSEYDIYNSLGMVLEARVVIDSRGIERVVLIDSQPVTFEESDLKSLLTHFLKILNYSEKELNEFDLPELVEESLKYKTL